MRSPRHFLVSQVSAAATSVFACCWLVPAQAGDWSLEAKTTQKADVETNRPMAEDIDGFLLGLQTNINADAIYKTDVSRFDLIGDLGYQTYFGFEQADAPTRLTPRIQTKYNQKGKTTSFDLAASFAREDVSFVDVLDPVLIPTKTYRDSLLVSASVSKNFDARTSAGLTSSFQQIFFEDSSSALTPSMSLTKQTTLRTSTSFSWLSLDDEASTDRQTVVARVDVTSQLSPRLKVRAGGGPRATLSQVDDITPPDTGRVNSTSWGWVSDAGFDYAYKRGSLSASISQATEPSATGDLQNRLTLGVAATRKMSDLSEIGATAQLRFAEVNDSDIQTVLSLSSTYSQKLTDEWSLQAGYRFTLLDEPAKDTYSNNVFLSISRAWVVKP
jgi:hypothetical protein